MDDNSMTTLCRYIRHSERAAYEADGWTVSEFRHGAHHRHYALLATKVVDDE